MNGWSRALAAVIAFVATAASAQVVSYSIEGPGQLNPLSQLSATYTVTAHYMNGTTGPAPSDAGTLASSDETVLAGPVTGAGVGGGVVFVPGAPGGARITFHARAGSALDQYKTVIVANGADVSGDLAFDCATEPAAPWQRYYPSALYLGRATGMVALCNGQVIVASAGGMRLQAIDTNSGQVLRNWPLRAAPLDLILLPGTQTLFSALADGSVARVDASTGTVTYVSLARPAAAVANFESGQVLAVSAEYASGSATSADATSIDVSNLATRTVAVDVPSTIAGTKATTLAYDTAHHALYYSHFQGAWLARFAYDVPSGAFAGAVVGAFASGRDTVLSPDGSHVLHLDGNHPNGGDWADVLTDFSGTDFPSEQGYFQTEGGANGAAFDAGGTKLLVSGLSRLLAFDVPTRKVQAAWTLHGCPGLFARARWSVRARYAVMLQDCMTPLSLASVIQSVQVLDPADPLPPALWRGPYGFSIDGPDSTDASVSTTVPYVVTRTDARDPTCPGTGSRQILTEPSTCDQYVVNGVGTVQLGFDAGSDGGIWRLVRVVSGPGATDPLNLDCGSEASDPSIYTRITMRVGEIAEMLPLCHGQVLVASVGLNRLQAIDVVNHRILRNWLLPGTPVAMVRVPGTNTVVVSLDTDQLARVDLVTGAIVQMSVPHAPQILVPYEPGYVLGLAQSFVPPATHNTDAYIIDPTALTLSSAGWPPSLVSVYAPTARYDATQHRLYFYMPETYAITQLAYDPATSSFVSVASTNPGIANPAFGLSPDGARLAYTVPGSVLGQYALLDVSTSPLGNVNGTYLASGSSASEYSADGARLASAAYLGVVVFDTATRAMLGGFSSSAAQCSNIERMRWSLSGRYIFSTRTCYPDAFTSELEVFVASAAGTLLPPPSLSVSTVSGLHDPLLPGQTVTFKGFVETSGIAPTGTLTYKDEGTPIPGCTAIPVAPSTSCTTSFALGGTHSITLSYSGDGLYPPARSGPWITTVLWVATISLASNPNPAGFGEPITFTANVSGGAVPPSGLVTFSENGMPVCQQAPLDVTGTATCRVSTLSAGTHSITAGYAGDHDYSSGSSPVLAQVVQPQGAAVNVALASNGGVASASSELGPEFPVASINDGERAGRAWSSGGGWADATPGQPPDWVQIDFNGPKAITQVVVYTLQDNWQSPLEPTDGMTFTQYGVTAFDVQGWSGSAWVTLANVAGNNLVKRSVPIFRYATTKIRIRVTGVLGSYARITEVEAMGTDASDSYPQPFAQNVALGSMGATAIASSQFDGAYPVSSVIDGDTRAANWSHEGGWADATADAYPDWVEVDLPAAAPIDHVTVYTLQDNWQMPATPTDSMTFTQYGIVDFSVQGWDGAQWVTLGNVTNNNLVKRTVQFASAFTTARIRVNVTRALGALSRIAEIQAWVVHGAAPPTASTNVALATAGASASASSQLSADYPVSAVIDGDPTGAGWTHGGGWANGVGDLLPYVEIDFARPSQIDRVVVYTLQDHWQNPSQPTDTMTFTLYGVTAFDVQIWNGAGWEAVAYVSGNNLVKRTVSFAAVTTSRIRIGVHAAMGGFARITEIEAWTSTGAPTSETNLALASTGAVASASSQYSLDFPVAAIIDGVASGAGWSFGGGWADGTPGRFPDWVQVTFPSLSTLDKVVVYTLQDDWQSPLPPTDAMTFTHYGITDFRVQGWDGSQWVTLASVTGNNLVKRTVTFNAFTTSQIRIVVDNALNGYARITEVEAWGASSGPSGTNWALASNGGFASASSQYSPAYPVRAVIDGDRKGSGWSMGGGWADMTVDLYPDWVDVDFDGLKTLNTVTLYTLQDNWRNSVEPTAGMTFTLYGITDFEVQAWDGMRWQVVATVSGNNLVKRSVPVSVTTSAIRINVTGSRGGLSRITEIEAFGN